jgi:hypothetical protein
MHLAFRDVEVDLVKGDDFAEGLGDPARTNGERCITPTLGSSLRRSDERGL